MFFFLLLFHVRLYWVHYKSINLTLCFPYVDAYSQDKTSDKQTVISDTPEDELFKCRSESQTSPVFSRHGSFYRQPVVCVEKLSQELIPASTGSINFDTQDSTVISTCPDRFRSPQQDSPCSKWQVFTQGDFKQTSDLLEDKDDHQNAKGNEDDTQIPDEDTHLPTQLSQGLSTDPDTCLSPSKRSQISSPKFVPENNNEDVTETSVSRTKMISHNFFTKK